MTESTDEEEPKSFIGYVRVSTKQQIAGNSLSYQKEAIESYCKNNKIKLVKIYADEGISAFKERPSFNACMNQLRNNPSINGVVVNELSRFGRSTVELISLITEIDQLKKEFVSLKESFDISDKMGRLVLTVLSAIADYERDLIRERMTAGREFAEAKGTRSGLPCHRPLKEIPWDKVKKWRKVKMSWTMIAKLLSNDAENIEYSITHQTLIKHARGKGLIK